jgi:hypothetical protein
MLTIFISMKLTVELIPRTCHGSNVRTLIPNKYWDKLRKESYEKAGGACEICGGKGKKQGFKHDLECHEIWNYNTETMTQELSGLIALCPMCHLCKHIGRALAMKKKDVAYKHMMLVNKISEAELDVYLDAIFLEYKEFSTKKWAIDLNYLSGKQGITESVLDKAHKKRLDENVKPYKKKKYGKKRKKKRTAKKVVSKRQAPSKRKK